MISMKRIAILGKLSIIAAFLSAAPLANNASAMVLDGSAEKAEMNALLDAFNDAASGDPTKCTEVGINKNPTKAEIKACDVTLGSGNKMAIVWCKTAVGKNKKHAKMQQKLCVKYRGPKRDGSGGDTDGHIRNHGTEFFHSVATGLDLINP